MATDSPNGARRTPLHITKSITWAAETGLLTFEWKDGEKTVFNLGELPVEQQTALMYWGCIARIQQGYVTSKGSPAVAREKAGKLWEQLKSGKGLAREENASYSIVVRALAALLKIPDPDAQERWSALSPEKKKEVGARSDVLAKIGELKAAASKPQASLASILK